MKKQLKKPVPMSTLDLRTLLLSILVRNAMNELYQEVMNEQGK